MLTTRYILYLIIIAAGFIFGMTQFRRLGKIKPVVILLGVTLVSEITSRLLAYTIRNSNPVYHFLNPLQVLLWGVFFYTVISNKKIHKAVPYVTAALVIFSVMNTLFWEGLKTFPGNFLNVETLFLFVGGFMLFIEMLDYPSSVNLFKQPVFIIGVSLIWFNMISFIFFLLFRTFLDNNISVVSLKTIHYISNILYYGLLLTAVSFNYFFNERSLR